MSKYQSLLDSKKVWTPCAVTAGSLTDGGEDVIHRALSLRVLEIPVADFIKDACKGDLPSDPVCKDLLDSNVIDEDKHDKALNFAADVHTDTSKYAKEAAVIKKHWLKLDRHPILKAVVLERSVFFVMLPILRALGDKGLRTISGDISRDETIHVATNTLVCSELGLQSDVSLNRLRKATVAWIVDSLADEVTSSALSEVQRKTLSKKFWLRSSDELYSKGKASDLSFTRASSMPAFFEASNENLPQYA
jgi:hypothetical protein